MGREVVQEREPGDRALGHPQRVPVGDVPIPVEHALALHVPQQRPDLGVGGTDQVQPDPVRTQSPGQLDQLGRAPPREILPT
nr:hypothetical protein GCM10020093_092480 [Planobispora longispora]